MKILVTGFEPFDGDKINPSVEAVRQLPVVIDGTFIVKQELPVAFQKSIQILVDVITKQQPDAVICTGLATGRALMTPEFVAINYIDAAIKDNAGRRPQNVPIASDGPTAYFSTLPLDDIVKFMRQANVPAAVSYTAGTYVCNNLMYGLLHYLKHYKPAVVGGFIHVPCLPEQAAKMTEATPSMSLSDITKGLEAATRAVVAYLNK
jgi:pyroglutamyl-peptidase